MNHVHNFESFINEASAATMTHSWSRKKGWGSPGEFSYAAAISYAGGRVPVLIIPRIDGKGVAGTEVYLSATNPFKYTDIQDMSDFIAGIKNVIQLIPTAWKEWNALPVESKIGNDNEVIDSLVPPKKLVVSMIAEPKGKKMYALLPEGDQEFVENEIRKQFPKAYDITPNPMSRQSLTLIGFTLDL
jgi:hypothetical protein